MHNMLHIEIKRYILIERKGIVTIAWFPIYAHSLIKLHWNYFVWSFLNIINVNQIIVWISLYLCLENDKCIITCTYEIF